MRAMTQFVAAIVVIAGATYLTSANASWWDSDRYDDRWHGGPWYGGGYPGYGWGGYPGNGWGGYPGYGWGGNPGYGRGSTIIVNMPNSDNSGNAALTQQSAPRLPE